MPFSGAETLLDAHVTGAPQCPLTFAQAMCWVGPETAIYTYDQFIASGDVVCERDNVEPTRLNKPVGDGSHQSVPTRALGDDVDDLGIGMLSSAHSSTARASVGILVLLSTISLN